MHQERIYEFMFGRIESELDYSDSDFQNEHGERFYYKVVMDDEMFYIHDTTGRMIPIDREFINGMNTAMFVVTSLYKADDEAEKLFDRELNKVMKLVDFWNEEERGE